MSSPAHRLRHIRDRAKLYLDQIGDGQATEAPDLIIREIIVLQHVIEIADLSLLTTSEASHQKTLYGIERICEAWHRHGFSNEFVRVCARANIDQLAVPSAALH